MSFDRVPGLIETREGFGETTVVVSSGELLAAALYLRDELGFNFLSDIAAADYLGWGGDVAGAWGSATGRDLNAPSSWGSSRLPAPKPTRFSLSYHLLALRDDPARLRLQIWISDGDPVPSVIEIWPAADWFEREAFDLMGISFDGHPNLVRILLPDDWEGHPLRKDYPLGGEPVRFSEES